MSAIFNNIDAQKEVAFPETMKDGSLEMLGNYGLTTPPKKRKRGRY